jgi:hypothetical protein
MKRTGVLLLGLVCFTSALADRTPANLKAFTSVCINAGYTEGETDNDDVSAVIVDAMFDKLDKAGIKVNDAPCQPRGTAASKQLNLYFSFLTTESLDVYSADLAGWLTKDGAFDTVDLWTVGRFGAFKKGTGQAKAIALANSTLDDFIKDWKTNHK